MDGKRKVKRWILLSAAISIALLLLINVGVSCNPFDGGGCISVTFDKLPMMLADRAVIRVGEKHYEITDRDFVRQITTETRCATNTDLCYNKTDRWIDIYCGNTLIRSMMWESEHNGIIVYEAGVFHWVFPSAEGQGIVDPSNDLLQNLKQVTE
jgi:hypothetical protein